MAHFDELNKQIFLSVEDEEIFQEANHNTQFHKTPNTDRVMKWVLGDAWTDNNKIKGGTKYEF